jgi:hypothetical protein
MPWAHKLEEARIVNKKVRMENILPDNYLPKLH